MSIRDLAIQSQYASSSSSLIRDFLAPTLSRAQSYDRAAGYFNSSLFVLAPVAWADFFLSGGKMRLLTSVELSKRDAQALEDGELSESDLESEFLNAWTQLVESPNGKTSIRLLRALVSSSSLELRVAAYLKPRGLFHDKLGIIRGGDSDCVSFTGSANETWNAWSGFGNHESFDVFRSWLPEDRDRVRAHEERFENYWMGRSAGLEVFQGERLRDVIIASGPEEDLEKVLDEVKREIEEAIPALKSKRSMRVRPGFNLRDYQLDAVENWAKSGNRGIISFATGGGKTLTALEIVNRWANAGGSVLVLVPTGILVSQWISEIDKYFQDAKVLRADSKSAVNWRKSIRAFLQSPKNQVQIVVATYKTASSPAFADLLEGIDQFLLVGDEVHRFGAKNTSIISERIHPAATLGLSATPLRAYDDEGTESIFEFFGAGLEPIYSLRDAIASSNLVPYRFSFAGVRLNDEEQSEWDLLTNKISKVLAIAGESPTMSPQLQSLLINRARIAKQAEGKASATAEILSNNFMPGDRWLVYCETNAHLALVSDSIRKVLPRVPILTYTSTNEDEHRDVLSHYERVGGILLAIRCLDEGVDLPLINKAIIVSSSTSPREFIQRRGRILRTHPGKNLAVLFDFLMEDVNGSILMPKELARLTEFAEDAINKEPYIRLKHLLSLTEIPGGGERKIG